MYGNLHPGILGRTQRAYENKNRIIQIYMSYRARALGARGAFWEKCNAMEWNIRETFDFCFFGQSDNFHFSKVAHCLSFLRGAFEHGLKKKECHKISYFEKCVFTAVF